MQKNLGLYIHIPFCQRKCNYCNFVSFCVGDDKKTEYVQSLKKEIAIQGQNYSNYIVDSIFIGGGTPTTLLDGQIAEILAEIKTYFNVSKNAEISIECNPNTLTTQKLKEYKNAGIGRLSIGLQAYSNKLLKIIGRLHDKKQFDIAFKNAKQEGFENINVDLILGLPNQKLWQVKRQLKHLVKLGVSHVSAYGLIVEDGTKLKSDIDSGIIKLPTEDKSIKMYDFTQKFLEKHGIFRYEVSNFAKKGYECKHNLKYWQNGEYLGLGAVSSSFVNGERWKNTDNLLIYNQQISKGVLPKEDFEKLSIQDEIEECIMLSLRTTLGIDLLQFQARFGIDLLKTKYAEICALKNQNLITVQNEKLACTNKGFNVLNQIILELI